MDIKQIVMDFCGMAGVAGAEGNAVDYARGLLERYGSVEITPLGSVVCRMWDMGPKAPHLLLDAHIDEIGLIVTSVEDGGFLRVANCGGVDRRMLAAAPVLIHARDGALTGVVCSTPPHLTGSGEKKNAKVDEIHIDTGMDKDAAAALISPGDRITFRSTARELLGGKVSGKSIDDRAGCAALLHAIDILHGSKPTCSLSILFSSMEEVGGQGAKTAAWALDPTHAIAVDVSFAHTPDSQREKCGEMGGGPMIGIAPILSASMSDKLVRYAKAADIPYQLEVMPGRTSTNADQIATTRAGVRCALISIPQKYMHTPVEAVQISDIEDTGRLIVEYIRHMEGGAAK